MKLRPIFVDEMPEFDAIKIGDIWISHKLRTINLRCPCGSGRLTVLTIQPSRWHVHFDGKSISLKGPTGGSVWANSCCGGHYKIRNNSVIWLDRIDSGRHSEYAKIELARMVNSTSRRQTLGSRLRRLWGGISFGRRR